MAIKLSSPRDFRRVIMMVVVVAVVRFFVASLLQHDRWSEQVG